MNVSPPMIDAAQRKLAEAEEKQLVTRAAALNIRTWLTESRYEHYLPELVGHIEGGKWQALDDAFWTIIPFGTGGRRGRMYPIGSNAINDRTIGESAQGLAEMLLEHRGADRDALSCAIAYDTRHNSRHFAELCASVMVANGFRVYFLDDYRATPQLSFAVRHRACDCGIMVTASHNPPSDNAVKVYWSTGGQVLPPHDRQIIDRVMSVEKILTVPFADAVADGRVTVVTDEIDSAYREAALEFAWPGPRECRVLYSPLHGVGSFAVLPLLEEAGFKDVTVYAPHAEPSGDFPNVPGNASNPENVKVFDEPIKAARAEGYDLILATDPDCDRMGAAAPVDGDPRGQWRTFNGNQLGALLCDYVLRRRAELGMASPGDYIVKTLVTTNLLAKIAESYGVRTEGNIHVGFKWIAGVMDAQGPEHFAYGTEESHGFLVGQYARDKDGAVACLLMSMLAADLKRRGVSMHQHLDGLYRKHGLHREALINVQMEGSQGMQLMQKLMATFRSDPPESLGGLGVARLRDYATQTAREVATGEARPLDAPKGDMVVLDLAEPGNYVAVRPSGTEPKVKFYFFSALSPQESQDLDAANARLTDRIAALQAAVQEFARGVKID